MSRSVGLAHIIRQPNGTSQGVWGTYTLQSAFQPIFRFTRGRLSVAAFEGLIRPFRDDAPLSPGTFFSSVPDSDRLHVETLTRTLHLLNAAACLSPDALIFVNFDPSLFVERSISETALREMRLTLHEASIDPHRIVCEVTEQHASSHTALFDFVFALRAHGFRIAVDDFGSDNSDMNRIRELKPDIVKFDARWITRLMESGPGFQLLATMVSTFAAQRIETVFEGIEESWQLDLAEKAGVSMVQGYVLAKPELAPTSFAVFQAGKPPAPDPAPTAPPTAHFGTAAPARTPRPSFGRRAAAG